MHINDLFQPFSSSTSSSLQLYGPLATTSAMKKGRTLSAWMSSALSKSSQSLDSSSCQGSSGPVPSLTSSHSLPPPTCSATHKPRKTVRRIKANESTGSSDSHSSSRSKNSVSPLTAGTLPGGDDAPWVDKHKPMAAADLAVHKKKVGEVQQWLEFALSSHARHPILLMSGPPGCGKTATIRALAQDMGFSILEWVNPSTEGASTAWNQGGGFFGTGRN